MLSRLSSREVNAACKPVLVELQQIAVCDLHEDGVKIVPGADPNPDPTQYE